MGNYPFTVGKGLNYNCSLNFPNRKSKRKITPTLKRKSARNEEANMTVCVAAIFGNNGIVGASDRMLTASDYVQYEPLRRKIYDIGSNVVIMTAGDSNFNYEILMELYRHYYPNLDAEKSSFNVGDVANSYCKKYHFIRDSRIENEYLASMGLTYESFWKGQQNMDSELANRIAAEMNDYEAPNVSAIITGLDSEGAHIFIIKNGEKECYNGIGFAAIGAGRNHAETVFMFESHTGIQPAYETMFRTFTAKKRAEVIAGVGKTTDMFFITNKGVDFFAPHQIAFVESKYNQVQKKHARIDKKVYTEMNEYEKEFNQPAERIETKKPETETFDSTGTPSPNSEEVPVDVEKSQSES